MPLNLDYYYGTEGEQYSFYRIPKTLFTDPRYNAVSMEAKVLYGLLLDRMSLSVRNGWMDKLRRIYIYFTQEDAMALMCCGKDKVTKLFRELDQGGIGLIERKKQGQGRPTLIYVKNFTLSPEPGQTTPDPEPVTPQPPVTPQTAENQQSGLLDSAVVKTTAFPQSAPLEVRGQEDGISVPNKTDKNKTDFIHTESSILPPAPSMPTAPTAPIGRPKSRMRMDEMDRCRERICENIDFDLLLEEHPYDRETLEGYVEMMVEVCCSRRDFIRIAGEEMATGVAKSRFMKLNHEHIAYVLESLSQNTTLVKNIKAYTLAALYNAPTTMGQYYASQISHDMAQGFRGA